MKRLLLIGNITQSNTYLKDYLSSYFDTQFSTCNLEVIRGIVKIRKPEIVVFSISGIEMSLDDIFDFFCFEANSLPMITIGSEAEYEHYSFYFKNPNIIALDNTVTAKNLLKECCGILGVSYEMLDNATDKPKRDKKLVLIVDDSSTLRRNLKENIKQFFDVALTASGEQAISYLNNNSPDVIVLDYEMPGMNGKETYEKIRSMRGVSDIPIVFLTGMSQEKEIREILKLKPNGYLLKPVVTEKLVEVINKVTGE